jgi:diamine N-acetyltransferase
MVQAPQRVSLREITSANRAEIELLAVAPGQDRFVAGVTDSLIEAAETPGACPWYRGVYDGESPVGFVMISDNIPPDRTEYLGPYFLWRLLIDARFQRLGYGRAVLDLIVEYVRVRPGAEILFTSHVPGEGGPLDFYLKYGFTLTGDVFDGEPVLALHLDGR